MSSRSDAKAKSATFREMKMNKRLLMTTVALLFGLLTLSVNLTAGEMKADAAMASDAITKAKAAQKKAASVNGEWRDTGKFIKNAEKAAKAGDFDKAVRLANKAANEGRLGYEQAVSQSKLQIPSYFKHYY